jgi:hypothetical protein
MGHQDVEKRVGFFLRRNRVNRRFTIGTRGQTELYVRVVKLFIGKFEVRSH